MIENGHIIALNDDAIEIGERIPCNFRHTSSGREYIKTQDGKTEYFDANIMIQADSFDYDGLAAYDMDGKHLGNYTIGQKHSNQMVGIFEMKCFKY